MYERQLKNVPDPHLWEMLKKERVSSRLTHLWEMIVRTRIWKYDMSKDRVLH